MQNPTVIFSHIPKAAGTTLHQILNRQYPAQAIFTVDFPRASVEAFKQLPEETRAGIRCLKGHMHFGLHRHLPQKSVYISILRDPVHRVISYYHHLLRSPKDLLHQEIISKNMSLEEFVTRGLASLCNDAQVRLLSGIENEDFVFPYASVPERALEAAKRNLTENFLAVGLSERFDESVLLFQKLLGWAYPVYTRENDGPAGGTRSNIPKETIKLIEEYNALDRKLYEFAKVRFEQMLREHGMDGWRAGLFIFQALNRCFGPALAFKKRWFPNNALPAPGV